MWCDVTRHHFENLDSVNSRGSSIDKYPIRTIRSQSRPRSISSSESSKKSLFIKWGSANLLPKSYYHYWQKAIKNRAQCIILEIPDKLSQWLWLSISGSSSIKIAFVGMFLTYPIYWVAITQTGCQLTIFEIKSMFWE